MSKKTVVAFTLFAVAIFGRLIPHAPNFTPIEAIALFGGAYLGRKYLPFLLTIIAIYFTDLILNNTLLRSFYPGQEGIIWFSPYMIWNAIAILMIVTIGWKLKLHRKKPAYIAGGALASSLVFFLVTNAGSWLTSGMYSNDIGGLISSYVAAIPFYKMSFMSNLLFTLVFFGTMYFVKDDSVSSVTERIDQ